MSNTQEEPYLLISDDGPGFYTLEGEGEYVGHPSVFMRLFGCNLTCKGFASVDSPWGCDSYISWSKKNKYTFEEMFAFYEKNGLVNNLRRGALWKITGGEPMLRQGPLLAFVEAFQERFGFVPNIDFETNGTIQPNEEWVNRWGATFTVSPKMSNNGDPKEKRYMPSVLNWHAMHNSCFKFVIDKQEDITELFSQYVDSPEFYIHPTRIWLMPCCGSREEHEVKGPIVAEYAKTYGFKFSSRLHLVLWNKALKV